MCSRWRPYWRHVVLTSINKPVRRRTLIMTTTRTIDERTEELDLQLACPFILSIHPTIMGGYIANIRPVDIAPSHILETYKEPVNIPLGSPTIMKKFINLFYSDPELVVKKYYRRKGVVPGGGSSRQNENFPTR